MGAVEKAIEAAYEGQIKGLYKALSNGIANAEGSEEEISSAERRFKNGLEHAADVRQRARQAAGL